MNPIIQKMVEEIDQETQAIWNETHENDRNRILLVGDSDSYFLRLVAHKAHKFGIETRYGDPNVRFGEVIVLDNDCKNEKLKEWAKARIEFEGIDIDHFVTPGTSCCAEACYKIIQATAGKSALITIAGRGHSQKGLYKELTNAGYSVLTVHSESPSCLLEDAIGESSIIVNTSPKVEWPGSGRTGRMAMEVCKINGYMDVTYTVPQSEIGALNLSILLNRFVEVD